MLTLAPPVVAAVSRVDGAGLSHHEAVEAKPELADVRGDLAHGEDTGRAVGASALDQEHESENMLVRRLTLK